MRGRQKTEEETHASKEQQVSRAACADPPAPQCAAAPSPPPPPPRAPPRRAPPAHLISLVQRVSASMPTTRSKKRCWRAASNERQRSPACAKLFSLGMMHFSRLPSSTWAAMGTGAALRTGSNLRGGAGRGGG